MHTNIRKYNFWLIPFLPAFVLDFSPFNKTVLLVVALNKRRTSLVAQMVKRLSTMRGTQVRSLGREDPLEKEMEIHSSTISPKIPWTEELGRLQSMGSQRVRHD